jgi:hypothetical protein
VLRDKRSVSKESLGARKLTSNGGPFAVCQHGESKFALFQDQYLLIQWQRAHLSTLISPQTLASRSVSPISMKYLHRWTCTTAARYQTIYSVERSVRELANNAEMYLC